MHSIEIFKNANKVGNITGNTFRLSISKILHIHTIKFQAFATLAQDTKTQKVRL